MLLKQVSHTGANTKHIVKICPRPPCTHTHTHTHAHTHTHTHTHTQHNPLWHLLSPLPSGSAVMASQPAATTAAGQSSRMWLMVPAAAFRDSWSFNPPPPSTSRWRMWGQEVHPDAQLLEKKRPESGVYNVHERESEQSESVFTRHLWLFPQTEWQVTA